MAVHTLLINMWPVRVPAGQEPNGTISGSFSRAAEQLERSALPACLRRTIITYGFQPCTEHHLPHPRQSVELLPIEERPKRRLPKEPTSAAALALQEVCLWPQMALEKRRCHSSLPSTVSYACATLWQLKIPTSSNPGLFSNYKMSVSLSRPASSTHPQRLGV